MLGLHVTVPVACFRKGFAREYLETEEVPPPATCYGFLLSLVGEVDRNRHVGCRVSVGLVSETRTSVVLRTIWRVKNKPLGSSGNTKPDYQQLLTGHSPEMPFINLVIWLDSTNEVANPNLEARVKGALKNPSEVSRFGGLSLGESTHLVDSVALLESELHKTLSAYTYKCFELSEKGRITLPVWVDHVSSRNTCYVTGNLVAKVFATPELHSLPTIQPQGLA